MKALLNSNVAQPFNPVKTVNTDLITGSPVPMIHHKVTSYPRKKNVLSRNTLSRQSYGVSRSHRILSPGLFIKKFDQIRDFLQYELGFTTAQREVTLRLLRYWAYYGKVFPKAAQIADLPGCSKATYWRTVRLLERLGLVDVINRFIIRPHAQISNLYRLDKLVLRIARYLAEHGITSFPAWVYRIIQAPAFSSQQVPPDQGILGPPLPLPAPLPLPL